MASANNLNNKSHVIRLLRFYGLAYKNCIYQFIFPYTDDKSSKMESIINFITPPIRIDCARVATAFRKTHSVTVKKNTFSCSAPKIYKNNAAQTAHRPYTHNWQNGLSFF